MMKRHLFLPFLLLTICAASGCATRPATELGAFAAGAPVVSVRELAAAGKPVTLHGTMVEKCMVAACWFRLRDETGVVKVDLKAGGFTVTDVPLDAALTVTGSARTEGDEVSLTATGLRY